MDTHHNLLKVKQVVGWLTLRNKMNYRNRHLSNPAEHVPDAIRHPKMLEWNNYNHLWGWFYHEELGNSSTQLTVCSGWDPKQIHNQSIWGFVWIVLLSIIWVTLDFVLWSYLISELIRGQILLSTNADGSKLNNCVVGSKRRHEAYRIFLCFRALWKWQMLAQTLQEWSWLSSGLFI